MTWNEPSVPPAGVNPDRKPLPPATNVQMPPKKSFTEPQVRVFTDTTEIPDTFPGAGYFRQRGLTTYLAVFSMSDAELAAAAEAVGADVVQRISALRRK